jgi:hypothetical protein
VIRRREEAERKCYIYGTPPEPYAAEKWDVDFQNTRIFGRLTDSFLDLISQYPAQPEEYLLQKYLRLF